MAAVIDRFYATGCRKIVRRARGSDPEPVASS